MQLLTKASIGSLSLENRVIFLATHLGYCKNGFVSDRLVRFYRERAKASSPGLIIIGGCYTEHLAMGSPTMIGISSDDHIEGLSRLVDEIHNYDVPVAAQLYHAGRYANSLVLGEKAVSASPVYCRLTHETPREMSIDEIYETIGNFGNAAKRAREAGFDAVEILGSAGYIINQFLAPCTNQRIDEYGGTLEARSCFPKEIIKSVKASFGNAGPVIYRISGADFVDGGLKLRHNLLLVQWLSEAGADCFNVTGGWHETRVPQITMNVPRGHYAYLAEKIAEVVNEPVIACNRINSPSIAEHILQRGKVDLIGVSRGFIADPSFLGKVKSNMNSSIRTCIGCNLGCLDKVFQFEPVTCAINPEAGYEGERGIGSISNGSLAVIGAGPTGLELSRVLRLRNYDVTLYERDPIPGGLLRLASRIPGRGEFASYISYMWQELKRLGVNLKFKTRASINNLQDQGYAAIICATGTIAGAPSIDGIELPHVTTAYDVINLEAEDIGHVSIIGGGALGCYVSLFLADKSESVDLFEKTDQLGTDLGRTTRWIILKSMKEKCVNIHLNAFVGDVTRDYLIVDEDGTTALHTTDTVVVATSPITDDRLYENLKSSGLNAYKVGGAENSMDLLKSVHEAYNFASKFRLT